MVPGPGSRDGARSLPCGGGAGSRLAGDLQCSPGLTAIPTALGGHSACAVAAGKGERYGVPFPLIVSFSRI